MENDRFKFRVWDNDLNLYITDAFNVAIKNNGWRAIIEIIGNVHEETSNGHD